MCLRHVLLSETTKVMFCDWRYQTYQKRMCASSKHVYSIHSHSMHSNKEYAEAISKHLNMPSGFFAFYLCPVFLQLNIPNYLGTLRLYIVVLRGRSYCRITEMCSWHLSSVLSVLSFTLPHFDRTF